MRFHVVALPHTQTHKRHAAYTTKVCRSCAYDEVARPHRLPLWCGGERGLACNEDVVVLTRAEQEEFFGPFDRMA